ncbi:MAG: hypothetical protein Q8K13_00125 [Parvibaculum sp.]|uniref:hypothetical protein n=1 Tax=Parvibaculum sp. TaxID=2024848 RepID=UPI00272F9EDB|nr:hypothetical protein [Parvibaculum sp.]MDP2148029.1 hypothetical protein [Parvibaculum sp.]
MAGKIFTGKETSASRRLPLQTARAEPIAEAEDFFRDRDCCAGFFFAALLRLDVLRFAIADACFLF